MKAISAYAVCFVSALYLGCGDETPTSPAVTYTVPAHGLALLAPVDGQQFRVGDTMTIEWTTDFSKIVGGVSFSVSPNNGALWLPLDPLLLHTIHQSDSAYGGTVHGSFRWAVVDSLSNVLREYSVISDSCKVRVYAPYDQDSLGVQYQAVSTGRFSIAR